MGNFKFGNSKNYISANAITVIDENGVNLGVIKTGDAKSLAYSHGGSLVAVAGKLDTYEIKKWAPRNNNNWNRPKTNDADNDRAQYEIHADTVRLTDENGNMVGVISTSEARKMASDKGLDLIAVNNSINPPIGKLGDLNKFMYEQKKKAKERDKKNRAQSKSTEVKVIQYPSDTTASSLNDRTRMMSQADDFMSEGHPVRFKIKFSGREVDHAPEVIERIKKDFVANLKHGSISNVDQDGKNVTIFCEPNRK